MKTHDQIVFANLLLNLGRFFQRSDYFQAKGDNKKQTTLNCCKHLFELFSIQESSVMKLVEQLLSDDHQQDNSSFKKLLQAADYFAGTEQEQDFIKVSHNSQKLRLQALLSKVSLHKQQKADEYFLPLRVLSFDAAAIFPEKPEALFMEKLNTGQESVWLEKENTNAAYLKLAEDFFKELQQVPKINTADPSSLRSFARTLLALSEKYLSQVPAAIPVLQADISLFDHLRISTAIAEGLYHYHAAQPDWAEADFMDTQTPKWLLVCGDFSGIQNFIYKITSKGAAKGLRGRSVFIQLLCDAISEQLIRTLGLYGTSRIYSSGGKFYLLIANSQREALETAVVKINAELLKRFRSEIFLGIGFAAVKADDFKEGNMGKGWQEANEDLMTNKQQAFAANLAIQSDFFKPEALHSLGACQVCDRDDRFAGIQIDKEEGFKICRQCQDLRKIGQKLIDTNYLFWAWGKNTRQMLKKLGLRYLHCIHLCGTDCSLYFLDHQPKFSNALDLSACHLERLNTFEANSESSQTYSTGFRLLGKWQKQKQSGDYDFEDFAKNAQGFKRMGVLRMDVDNLGEIFIRGLDKQTSTGYESMGSLSRVATLSRQLHLFFAGYLSSLCDEFENCQIIYAGGDDVFIIGSWHELPCLAKKIRDEFKRYCADNDSFTLSGGIALATGKYPISKSAELAGRAEENAKHLQRGSNKKKDALCFLDTEIGWESFKDAIDLKDDITKLAKDTNSNAIIDRLRRVVIATNEIKKHHPNPTPELLYWNQWRWRLIYNLKRMSNRYPNSKDELAALQKRLLQTEHQENRQVLLDWLQIPVRWAEFIMREEK